MTTQDTGVPNFSAPVPSEGIGPQQLPGEDGLRRPKRGDINRDGLYFWRFKRGRETWVSKATFEGWQERHKAIMQEHRKTDTFVATRNKWQDENADRIQKKSKAWRLANRADCIRNTIEWKAANPEKVRVLRAASFIRSKEDPKGYAYRRRQSAFSGRIRRTLKHGGYLRADGQDTIGILFLLWARQFFPPTQDLEIDHLFPVSWFMRTRAPIDELNDPLNVRWVTPRDNQDKATLLPTPEVLLAHEQLVARWYLEMNTYTL